jgi:SAM-dependent methyltransferase
MTGLLRRLATPPEVVTKRDTVLAAAYRHGASLGDVLNVGSKNIRIGDSINLDVVPGPAVDVIGDAHQLARYFDAETFDTVVISAALQYCENPRQVIEQAHYVLRPGGWLFIDAPFIQPYCSDGADLWRFTAEGLRRLCEPYLTVVEVSTSIATGPAIALAAQAAARTGRNRYVSAALAWAVTLAVWPLRYLRHSDPRTAGAFLLVARKGARKALQDSASLESPRLPRHVADADRGGAPS